MTPTPEQIERVARAIAAHRWKTIEVPAGNTQCESEYVGYIWGRWIPEAKAAIAAMDKDGEVERFKEVLETVEDALRRVKDWCDAYPEDIFVPPTKEQWKQAHEHFKTLGFSVDKISGEYGRIWAKGQRPHVEAALKAIEALNPRSSSHE